MTMTKRKSRRLSRKDLRRRGRKSKGNEDYDIGDVLSVVWL
jgi:hypothetical protein